MSKHQHLTQELGKFSQQIIELKALLFAVTVADDIPEQALNLASGGERLVKLLEGDFDAIRRGIIDIVSTPAPTPAPAGSEAQALLNLMLTMLKHWRAQEISGNEFEAWLEQGVSLASTLAEVQHG